MDPADWHAKGLLGDLIKNPNLPKYHAWGQPMHLYFASPDDAAMLKLQCGHFIERFEKFLSLITFNHSHVFSYFRLS